MLLIRNIDVYAPEALGVKDVLIGGNKILKIANDLSAWAQDIQVIDGSNKKLLPGFIDQHVRITGGGGEGSFRTRVPEITLSKLTRAGVTTVVGLLGTDSTTRSVENLVAKAKALKEEGISAYALTGSYDFPTVTLTGEVKKDISFVEEIIGCKLAISDHRCPNLTLEQLTQLASDVRVAGMLSGKAGILTLHMGDGKEGMSPIFEVLNKTNLPVRTMRPTHVNRQEKLLYQAFEYAKMGGLIDMTCGIKKNMRPADAVELALNSNVPQENITISSDGYGSWSKYDDQGNLKEIGVAQVDKNFNEFVYMVKEKGLCISQALLYFTSNVAKGLNLYPQKGSISEGSDGDVLIIDDSMDLDTVICMGKIAILEKEVLRYGTYEE